MDYKTLQEYVDGLVADVVSLQEKYQPQIAKKQELELNIASMSNFLGNAKHYIHELSTAVNGQAQEVILKATEEGVEAAQDSLRSLHQKEVMTEEEYIILDGKISNLSLLVRSTMDPDYAN